MSNITERELIWVWRPYIPCGKVSNIYGEMNTGKTHLALAIVAAVTGGHTLPSQESPNELIHVLLQTPEDQLNDVIKPRLTRRGANCDLIHVAPSELGCKDSDLNAFENIINEIGVKLFVVDPLELYLYNANEREYFSYVRRLSHLAASTNCAVVLVGNELPPAAQEIVHSLIIVGPEDGEDKYLRGLSQMTSILGENFNDYAEDVLFRIHPKEGFQWVESRSIVNE
jgi:hypothetical protein